MDLISWANSEPSLSAFNDGHVRFERGGVDHFDLKSSIGPIYDIIRHRDTLAPLSVAICGTWGCGKTLAMRCLAHLLGIWNETNSESKRIPVWFKPWKYQNKEDIWKGIICEIVRARLNEGSDAKSLVAAMKAAVPLVGKSIVNLLPKFNSLGFEFDPKDILKVASDASELADHTRPFLNQFEDALRVWIETYYGKNERLVLFIDDLDRCAPQIAIEVLEAMKLYLDTDRLIFVVGVDRTMLQLAVKQHYKEMGLPENRSVEYLAKMFQLEVELIPGEEQMKGLLDAELDALANSSQGWSQLSSEEVEPLKECLLTLSRRNPRELKRLLNTGNTIACSGSTGVGFTQRFQSFLIRYYVSQRHPNLLDRLDETFEDTLAFRADQCKKHVSESTEDRLASVDDWEELKQQLASKSRTPISTEFDDFKGLIMSPVIERLLRLDYQKGSMAQVEAASLHFSSSFVEDDPNRGRFGGRASSAGYTLSATLSPHPGHRFMNVRLAVAAPENKHGEEVIFYLHPTFRPANVRPVKFKGESATVTVVAYGAFVVGAELADLDLMQVPGASHDWYSR